MVLSLVIGAMPQLTEREQDQSDKYIRCDRLSAKRPRDRDHPERQGTRELPIHMEASLATGAQAPHGMERIRLALHVVTVDAKA